MNEELEKAIDDAGRDHVFTRAKSYGWDAGAGVPEFVWWGIIHEIKNKVPPPSSYQRQPTGFFESLFGFSL